MKQWEAFANFKNHNSGSQSNESEILDESEESGVDQDEFDGFEEEEAAFEETSGSIVRIARFHPAMDVFNSLQRPRKMLMAGTDGIQYSFLLKGHEDLRQDERVMQLFGLVNELLKGGDQIDIETRRLDLSIRRYSVVPLSHDAGLVGVSSCFISRFAHCIILDGF